MSEEIVALFGGLRVVGDRDVVRRDPSSPTDLPRLKDTNSGRKMPPKSKTATRHLRNSLWKLMSFDEAMAHECRDGVTRLKLWQLRTVLKEFSCYPTFGLFITRGSMLSMLTTRVEKTKLRLFYAPLAPKLHQTTESVQC